MEEHQPPTGEGEIEYPVNILMVLDTELKEFPGSGDRLDIRSPHIQPILGQQVRDEDELRLALGERASMKSLTGDFPLSAA